MILTAAHLVTGNAVTVLHDAALRIVDNHIAEIGHPAPLHEAFPEDPVMDFGEATILPGLIDLHVHIGRTWGYRPDAKFFDDYLVAWYAYWNAHRALSVGVTTLRDMNSEHMLLERLRYAGEAGFVKIPRILHCDCMISMTNGHGDIISRNLANRHTRPEVRGKYPTADGPWECRRSVREALVNGADWIKACTSHRDPIPEYTQEELDAIVDETHRFGRKCAVHAGIEPGIDMAIKAGFDTIEHGTFLTLSQAEEMKAKGQAWVPTMTAYTLAYESMKEEYEKAGDISDKTLAKSVGRYGYFRDAAFAYRDNFKAIYDTGVLIGAGTDCVINGSPAAPVAKELAYMVQYGITPLQAIQIGTENSARILGMEDRIGTLEKGKEADITVCSGDASSDILALSKVRASFVGGKLLYSEDCQSVF